MTFFDVSATAMILLFIQNISRTVVLGVFLNKRPLVVGTYFGESVGIFLFWPLACSKCGRKFTSIFSFVNYSTTFGTYNVHTRHTYHTLKNTDDDSMMSSDYENL